MAVKSAGTPSWL